MTAVSLTIRVMLLSAGEAIKCCVQLHAAKVDQHGWLACVAQR